MVKRGKPNDREPGEVRVPEHVERTRGRPGGDYHYERDILLARAADQENARERLDDLGVRVESVEPLDALRIVRLRIRSKKQVPEIVDELHRSGPTPPGVTPNHVLGSCPHGSPIPVTAPRPAPGRPTPYEQPGLPGEDVRVGVFDTGAWEHPYFGGRCEFRRPADLDVADADGDGKLDHDAGHGTFIAGLVVRHAPRATVVARRFSHEPGPAPRPSCVSDTMLAQGLTANPELADVDVLTLALGGYTHDGMGLLATEVALRQYLADNPELVIVAGAGNDARSDPFFPAAFKFVIGVGALDAAGGQVACFSNRGWWVDAAAPGQELHSTFLHHHGELAPHPGTVATQCEGVLADPPSGTVEFDGWAHWDGTSFAAPQVAAAVAARISEGHTATEAVHDVLFARGTRRAPGVGTVVIPRPHP